MKYVTPRLKAMLHGGDYNPDQWLRYPEILDKDIELMKKSGCNAMSVGIFAWAALEPEEGRYEFGWLDDIIAKMYANGIYTILATPSGARPAWMAEKYPDVMRMPPEGERLPFSSRHNHCYSSPVYREKVRAINAALAERYAGNPAVILWHISNEYSGECWCDRCVAGFREWLKKKYKTLDALNDAWWTAFWSHTYTSWEQIKPLANDPSVHGLTLDWKRYVTDMTVDFMRAEVEPLKAVNPDIPVTTNMMGMFERLNYGKFREINEVISWDNYPLWHSGDDTELAVRIGLQHDILRSYKPNQPYLMMESVPSATNWQEVAKLKRPGMHELSSLQAIAHGCDSVQYFQWRKSRGGSEKFHGAVVDHYGGEDTRVFRDVASLGRRLAGLGELTGTEYRSKAAIIFDTENRWAINASQCLRDSDKGYVDAALSAYAPFYKLGVNVDVVDCEADLTPYKLIVAPMLYMLRAGIAEKLRNFVRDGGTLVATYWTGIVDENDRCFLGGVPGDGLSELFGLRAEEIDSLYPQDENSSTWGGVTYKIREYCELLKTTTAETLSTYDSDFYAGRPALTVNDFGDGAAYYVAAKFGDDFFFDFLGTLIGECGLSPDVTSADGVYVTERTGDDARYIIVQNFNDAPASFTASVPTRDLETGEHVFGEASVAAYGTRILKA